MRVSRTMMKDSLRRDTRDMEVLNDNNEFSLVEAMKGKGIIK
jgi:hypothetical protein